MRAGRLSMMGDEFILNIKENFGRECWSSLISPAEYQTPGWRVCVSMQVVKRLQNREISLPKAQFRNLCTGNTSTTSPLTLPSTQQDTKPERRGSSPISRDQDLVPPTNTHRQIRPSPDQPRSPATDIAHHTFRLHQSLGIT